MAALQGGAHVYVEKPFALSVRDGRAIAGRGGGRAAPRLRRTPAAPRSRLRAADGGRSGSRYDGAGSTATSRSARRAPPRAGPVRPRSRRSWWTSCPIRSTRSCRCSSGSRRTQPIEVSGVQATSTDVQALLRAGEIVGRLSVSLRARPVASSLTLTGTHGALTCDFVRSMVVGAGNPGTEPLEKILNPIIEGSQLQARSALGLVRRIRSGSAYPGLFELIDAFYRAAATGRTISGVAGASPDRDRHLRIAGVGSRGRGRPHAHRARRRAAPPRRAARRRHRRPRLPRQRDLPRAAARARHRSRQRPRRRPASSSG